MFCSFIQLLLVVSFAIQLGVDWYLISIVHLPRSAMEQLIIILLGLFFASAVVSQISLFVVRWWRKSGVLETKVSSDFDRYEKVEHAIDVLSIAFLWYSISLSFTLFNKWFMQEWQGGFHFPIFITSIHMVMKLFISRVWSISPAVEKIEPLSWDVLITIVLPIGAMTAGDVVLSNISILYLPLSVVTAIKGSSLVFTFLWGVVLKIEEFRWQLLVSVLCITLGLAVAVSNSMSINAVGIACAFGAAAVGGLRWALMQLLADKDSQSKSVMVTLYRFAPASVLSILPFVMALEAHKLADSRFAHKPKTFYDASLLCAFGGVIAFLLIIAEVKLLRLTSSLTMSVFGQAKEIIQILLAMLMFKENVSMHSAVGIGISILGSLYYRYAIIGAKETAAMTPTKGSEEQLNLLEGREMVVLGKASDEYSADR